MLSLSQLRSGNEPIPGCVGDPVAGEDYCRYPDSTAPPTPPPTAGVTASPTPEPTEPVTPPPPTPNEVTYEMLQEVTGSCPAGKEITTVEECKLAGESLSLNLRDGSVVVGSWSWVPCGCASCLGCGGDIHFDTNFDNCGPDQNDGTWRSICKQGVTASPTAEPTVPGTTPTQPPSPPALQLIFTGIGAPESPLLECQGDCDDDSHCAGDLVCFQRYGIFDIERTSTALTSFSVRASFLWISNDDTRHNNLTI